MKLAYCDVTSCNVLGNRFSMSGKGRTGEVGGWVQRAWLSLSALEMAWLALGEPLLSSYARTS